MFFVYLLAAVVVPLVITPGLLLHFDIAPRVILLAVTAALALLCFPAFQRGVEALRTRREGRWLLVLAVAQLVWFGVASLTSSRPWFSLFGSGWRRLGFVELASLMVVGVAVAGGLAANPKGVRTSLRMIVMAGLVASVYGICEYFGVDPLQPVAAYQSHAGDSVIVRPPGTMGHADYFGWWLAVEFFCAIALFRSDEGVWRYAGAGAAASILTAIVLSGTRAALLAVLVGGTAMLVIAGVRIGRKHLISGVAAAVLLAAFVFSPAGKLLRARVVWSGDEPLGGARPLLWRDSIRMAAARPVTGFGPETYLSAFALYQSEDLSRLFPDFHHESPHNLALDGLTAMGIPGLVLLVGWAAVAWVGVAAALREGSVVAGPIGGALIASATASMFSAAAIGPLLLTLLALAVVIAGCPSAVEVYSGKKNRGSSFWFVPAVAVALLLLSFGGVYGVYELQLQRFSLHPDEVGYQSLLKVSLPGAADDVYASRMLQLECQKRNEPGLYVICIQQTLRAGARALRTEDDTANAWYSLAMLSAAQRNLFGTQQGLTNAIHASPNWFKPHWTLARLLSQDGTKQQAHAEAVRAAFLDSNRDPEVVETATQLGGSR